MFFLDRDVRIAPDLNGPCLPLANTQRRPLLLNLAPEVKPIRTIAVIKHGCPAPHALRTLWAIHRAGFKFIHVELQTLTAEAATAMIKSSPSEFPGADADAASAKGYVDSLVGARCWILGIERVNAVAAWRSIMGAANPVDAKAADEFSLRATFSSGGAMANELFGSESYDAAVAESAALLQAGTYNLSGVVHRAEVVALVETAVVVVTAAALKAVPMPELIETLSERGFVILAATRRALSSTEADGYVAIQSAEPGADVVLRAQRVRAAITAGPCLVLAVERENAVTCSEMLLARGTLKEHFGTTLLVSCSRRAADTERELFFSA
jgi:nucleoside diphosphate kinase